MHLAFRELFALAGDLAVTMKSMQYTINQLLYLTFQHLRIPQADGEQILSQGSEIPNAAPYYCNAHNGFCHLQVV